MALFQNKIMRETKIDLEIELAMVFFIFTESAQSCQNQTAKIKHTGVSK